MTAYYNEIDADAAAILRQLIQEGVIAPGDVDTRSIKEVMPADVRGYTQCHFFAGGGLWSVAARLAGWPDNRRIWTGSCPCQGESSAGKRLGADDPRHLWPDFFRIIRACRPSVVMGEQVAAAAGTHWLDGTCSDLAIENYAARAVDIPACAVDAPHQRNRLFWIAVDSVLRNAAGERREETVREPRDNAAAPVQRATNRTERSHGADRIFADAQEQRGRPGLCQIGAERHGAFVADGHGRLQSDADQPEFQGQPPAGQLPIIQPDARSLRNGSWWADSEWIVSPLDGKARRTKPGLPFLVDGLPGRMGLWRVGGNAVSPILTAEVIAAFLESEDGMTVSSQETK